MKNDKDGKLTEVRLNIHPLELKVSPKRVTSRQWIFSNEVTPLDDARLDELRSCLVNVTATRRLGIYSKPNLNCVRLFPQSFSSLLSETSVSSHSFVQLLAEQLKKVRSWKLAMVPQGEAFRWMHGDSDGLPGVVLDDYGAFLVVQFGSRAGEFLAPFVKSALEGIESRPIFERSSGQSRSAEGLPERTRWLSGEMGGELLNTRFCNLDMSFSAQRAQKTGLFLDQRENLQFVQSHFSTAYPQRVLDICSYVGAWSASLARRGAREFVLIDQDKRALELATRNIERNATAPVKIEVVHGDLFESLSKLQAGGRSFDAVVSDPPAFAKSAKHVPEARRAYARLAKLSSKLVRENGLLVACSCSRNMMEDEFYETVVNNLDEGDWVLRARGNQSADHTVAAQESYSNYLKCFFFIRRAL